MRTLNYRLSKSLPSQWWTKPTRFRFRIPAAKPTMKGEFARVHSSEWRNLNSNRQSNIFLEERDASRAGLLLPSRREKKTILELLTRDYSLNMAKISIVVSFVSSQSAEEQMTARHFLYSYPHFSSSNEIFFVYHQNIRLLFDF